MAVNSGIQAGRSSGRRTLVIVAGLVLAGLLAVLAAGLIRGRSDAGAVTGDAPGFELATFDGRTFRSAEHLDRPLFVYFWASWCTPCKSEAPTIQELWESEYKAKGYAFVGVNMWDTEDDARAFVQEYGLTFPVGRDANGKVYIEFGVESLPMAFFIRPGGEIERRFLGQLEAAPLRDMLDKIAPRSRGAS